MFLYQTQPHQEGAILVVVFDLGDYEMTYHHMYQDEDHQLITFTQNRLPTNDDIIYIRDWIQPRYEEFHVMNLFRMSFENMLTQNELVVHLH